MAQIVKLRRSTVQGQKPTNSNLQLGELAINTTDGKVFFAKSGSLGPSVEELISTNTINTGSLSVTGIISASALQGDGLNVINIPLSGVTNLTTISGSINTRLGSLETASGSVQLPPNIVSGSSQISFNGISDKPTLISGSSQITFSGLTGVPSGIVSGSSQILNGSGVWSGSAQLPTGIISSSAQLPSGTVSGSSQIDITSTTGYSTFSSSLATIDLNQDTKISGLETASGSLNSYTSSNNINVGTLQMAVSMLNSYTSSNNNRLFLIEGTTGSLNTFSSSINSAIETTGSNLTVKGNLLVKGTTTTINSTTLDIADNVVQLNGTGATNAGLIVRDATSPNVVSGSLLWDSTNDQWVAGPLGSEQKIALVTDLSSLIYHTGSANGRLTSIETATSSLNTFTSSINTTIKSKLNTDVVMSGSYLGTATTTNLGEGTNLYYTDARVKTKLNAENVISSSIQVGFTSLNSIPSGLVSGSSQVLSGTAIHSGSFFNGISVVSGSGQIAFGGITGVPSGLVSGSSQITGISNSQLTNSSFYVGTTAISLGRASSSQTLTGVSIDGNAATSTTVTGTNIGSTTGPLSTITSAAGWAEPSGFNKMVTASGSSGLPSTGTASPYYGYTVLSRRDAASGYSGVLIGYNNDEMWFTYNQVGSNYATWKRVWHEGNLTNLNQLTNGPGYITSAGTAANVSGTVAIANGGTGGTTAAGARTNLGLVIGTDVLAYRTFGTAASSNTGDFAAYNATHYVGTTAIAANRTSASQTLTGVSIDGNAGSASSVAWSGVSSKPTTLSGYGITDAWSAEGSWKPTSLSSSTRLIGKTSPDGGEFGLAYTGGQIHAYVDGFFYQNEGAYRVIDSNSISSQSVNYATTAGNITAYTINQSVGTGNSPTFAGITVNGTVIASQSGFQSATYSAGRNRIWSFGNADTYGISYFQGSGGYGGSTDMIGFHFGTASVAASKFTFVSDGRFITSGDILPSANNSYNLGSATYGWANVYTNDLHLSNMNKPEGNDIDGTSGTWTIQEGAENLYIINNRNGKKFKINLEEI